MYVCSWLRYLIQVRVVELLELLELWLTDHTNTPWVYSVPSAVAQENGTIYLLLLLLLHHFSSGMVLFPLSHVMSCHAMPAPACPVLSCPVLSRQCFS